MEVFAKSRSHAGRIAAIALEFVRDVHIQDQSGSEPFFVVAFDDRVVMNDEERAQVASVL